MIKISPSMLASDFSQLGNEIKAMEQAGADRIHLDVMDGHFVPNLSFGAPIIAKIRACSAIFFDTHLMISNPLQYAEDFVKAGSDSITFHLESDSDTQETINKIKSLGAKVGISLKPATSVGELVPFLPQLDMVLIMTVEPGFGGQSFMADLMPKIEELAAIKKRDNLSFAIEVDGGIDMNTIPVAAKAGARIFVAGTALFSQNDYAVAVKKLRTTAERAIEENANQSV